jgi:hypothetical protein
LASGAGRGRLRSGRSISGCLSEKPFTEVCCPPEESSAQSGRQRTAGGPAQNRDAFFQWPKA